MATSRYTRQGVPARAFVAITPGPTAAEPPRVSALRASVAMPAPVATSAVGQLIATAPGAVATLLFLILAGSTPARVTYFLVEDVLKLVLILCHTSK